jgi:integrase
MSTRSTNAEKKLHGIQQIGPKLFLVRIQKVNPRTGLAYDVRKRVHCQRIEQAVTERERLLAESQRGGPDGQAKRVRLGDYAKSWLTGRLPTLKPSTAARYADTLDRFILPGLGDFYLEALDSKDVLDWFKTVSADKAATTANGYLRVLKTVVADAVAQYKLPFNPTARIRAIPERGQEELESDDPVNMFTGEEIGRFLEALRVRWPQWYTMLYLQFAMVCRFSDVSALQWRDVDWKKRIIRIRRGNWHTIVSTAKIDRRRKTIGLTDELRDVLEAWRQELLRSKHRHADSGWMFPSRAGKPHHNSSCLTKVFADCLKAIGVERRFSSHGLRRTANNILRRRFGGEVARAMSGHVTEKMTEHYAHIDPSEKREAVQWMLDMVRSRGKPENDNPVDGGAGEAEAGGNQNRHIARHMLQKNRHIRPGGERRGVRSPVISRY